MVRILGGKEEVFRGECDVFKWWKGKKVQGEMMWKGGAKVLWKEDEEGLHILNIGEDTSSIGGEMQDK